MIKYSHKLLGHVDISKTVTKLDTIKDWTSLKVNGSITMEEKDPVEMIILFSLPDKQNLVLQKLITKPDLLNLFKEEIDSVWNIVKQHYDNMEPKRIVLNKFLAHEKIAEHVDFLYHYDNTVRTHLPIITNERVVFNFSDETIHMKSGDVYEFNNSIPHAVVNDSDLDRIHLIIDWGDVNDSYYGNKHYGVEA